MIRQGHIELEQGSDLGRGGTALRAGSPMSVVLPEEAGARFLTRRIDSDPVCHVPRSRHPQQSINDETRAKQEMGPSRSAVVFCACEVDEWVCGKRLGNQLGTGGPGRSETRQRDGFGANAAAAPNPGQSDDALRGSPIAGRVGSALICLVSSRQWGASREQSVAGGDWAGPEGFRQRRGCMHRTVTQTPAPSR
ncbi:hypothetical protein M409DRAFT_60062 [Zasmidium cellare ATCC 36951]|uniref:Uncharacterized protein n=1 Tax=Zasmidium cellare ATCC 36951 TaxID=1080233 RepID=A0A6A6C069_ZASCE|nr:uncharacterized protein M409DRAFT_60062 [Zasmidium cellare ATCC 36951]KAF2160365.1 hypothetical protein M409DRAFT_60062 [Zasmidium cellare ATCC 36951]